MPKMPGGDEKKEESAESKEEAAEQVIIRFICCSLKGTSQTILFCTNCLFFGIFGLFPLWAFQRKSGPSQFADLSDIFF
jgi:hypothetical protein